MLIKAQSWTEINAKCFMADFSEPAVYNRTSHGVHCLGMNNATNYGLYTQQYLQSI